MFSLLLFIYTYIVYISLHNTIVFENSEKYMYFYVDRFSFSSNKLLFIAGLGGGEQDGRHLHLGYLCPVKCSF